MSYGASVSRLSLWAGLPEVAIRLVVFDCDGVLFESEEANIAFYDRVMARAGVPAVDWRRQQATHALASAELFQHFYGDRPEMLAAIKEAATATDYGPSFALMRPRAGMREVVGLLHGSYHTAIATNRSRTLGGVIEHFELGFLFDFAVGACDVERPKPDPEMLLKCVTHFGLDAGETVYVGDQEVDREAAGRAGVRFIATGPHFAGQDFHVDELGALTGLLLDAASATARSGQTVEVVD